jgi:hypothetical protein
MFTKQTKNEINFDMQRITPFLELLKLYAFVDSNKELYDSQVNHRLLKPLLIKG